MTGLATNETFPEVCPCKRISNYLSNRIEKPTVERLFRKNEADERNIWRDTCVVFVSEYFQSADLAYVLADRRRHRSYQKTRISVNRYAEKQKFPCPTCPSVFSHKNNLYYHSKFECGQLPRFNCPYCVYRTKHVSNVRAHVRRKHPGHSVYAIDVCKILGT